MPTDGINFIDGNLYILNEDGTTSFLSEIRDIKIESEIPNGENEKVFDFNCNKEFSCELETKINPILFYKIMLGLDNLPIRIINLAYNHKKNRVRKKNKNRLNKITNKRYGLKIKNN